MGGPNNVYFSHQGVSQRAVQTSLEKQLDRVFLWKPKRLVIFPGGSLSPSGSAHVTITEIHVYKIIQLLKQSF